MSKVIYISGPMTGLPECNYPAFYKAEEQLRAGGHGSVINLARLGRAPGYTWADYMRKDIQLLLMATDVYALNGWENSRGARLEINIARELGMTVWEERDHLDFMQSDISAIKLITCINVKASDLLKGGGASLDNVKVSLGGVLGSVDDKLNAVKNKNISGKN